MYSEYIDKKIMYTSSTCIWIEKKSYCKLHLLYRYMQCGSDAPFVGSEDQAVDLCSRILWKSLVQLAEDSRVWASSIDSNLNVFPNATVNYVYQSSIYEVQIILDLNNVQKYHSDY